MMPKSFKTFILLFMINTIVYVGSYLPLTLAGTYEATISGTWRYSSEWGVMDQAQWQPKYCQLTYKLSINGHFETQGDFPGALYSPLIILDRYYRHPNFDLVPPSLIIPLKLVRHWDGNISGWMLIGAGVVLLAGLLIVTYLNMLVLPYIQKRRNMKNTA